MKTFLIFCALFAGLHAAEPVFVTVGATTYPARTVDFAATKTVTGTLVFGGLGDSPDASWFGRVVLLDRGVLSFAEKVKKVTAAGGIAVIIANTLEGQPANPATLGVENTSTLPAVTVSQADGTALKGRAGASVRVGTAAPPASPVALPDPAGHPGEYLSSDGEKYALAKMPDTDPAVSATTEVAGGKSVTFGVSASGSAPFTFQWMKDGANIAGATVASFFIAAAVPADSGGYACQVANLSGTKTSSVLVLIVK